MLIENRHVKSLLIFAILILPTASLAEYYKVSVSKKGDNLYKVEGQNIYIITKFCIELALGEDVILDIDATGQGKMMFPNSNSSCDVEKILK